MALPGGVTEDRPLQRTVSATAAVIVAVMPSFLVGASGVMLRADLGFTEAGLGVAVSVFFGATAIASVMGGRVTERIGGRPALVFIGLASAAVLLGIALFAQRLSHLIVLLALGGFVNGIAQPASNLVLARGVVSRQALMFGIKQAAIPFATLFAGASVPLVGLTVGWRWSFALGAAAAVLIALLVPRDLGGPQRRPDASVSSPRQGDAAAGPLVALAIAAGAGMAAGASLGTFLVESAVAAGMAVGVAGGLQVAGSAAGAVGRITAGWIADRRRGIALAVVSGMLFAGAVGYVMLATGRPELVLGGAIIAYACGWGWTGLIMFAVVRFNPNAPAAATGIVMTGSASGAAAGPFAFGFVAAGLSFAVAWMMAASLALASMVLVLFARRWLIRDRARREAAR